MRLIYMKTLKMLCLPLQTFRLEGSWLLLFGWIFLVTACSTIEPTTVEQKYDLAIQHIDKGNYPLAEPILKEITQENPGTRYATFSFLKLGDALMETGESKYSESETNYRIFLEYSPNSHLVPYVLSKLIELNFKRNSSLLFGSDYSYARDPEHFKKIIMEYQRFYLLYPDSLYLENAKEYLDKSIEALANHEFFIGNWYFKHNLYTAAISRYRYVLKNYPYSSLRMEVLEKLIKSYKKNQQPNLAKELERIQSNKL